jgi:hypothetical protein
MEIADASRIIKSLSDGIDPDSNEQLPTDSVYQRPPVVRALCLAAETLDRVVHNRERKRRLPINAGKPWTRSEDEELCREFDGGDKVFSMAMHHNRTVASIAARLVRLNKLSADELPRLVGSERASRITDYEVSRRSVAKESIDGTSMTSKAG